MMDLYMKFGMVIVAVAVIGMLLAMGYRTINEPVVPLDKAQSFSGIAADGLIRLNSLCLSCTKSGADRECFIVTMAVTSGNLTNSSFHGKSSYQGSIINSSPSVIKLASMNGICTIRRLSDG